MNNIDEYILQNYKTQTNAQMAEKCKCCTSTISNHRKKLGLSNLERNKKLQQKAEYICNQYGKKTRQQIAKELNCSVSYIQKILNANKITGTVRNTYYYDDYYFHDIDCPNKAYWLGFIASDGCVYKRERHEDTLNLSLKQDDFEILKELQNQLKTTKPISFSQSDRTATLQISSNQLCQDLKNIGIEQTKTFKMSITNILSNISLKYWNAFILGYFDGDGSIDIPQHTISKSHVRIAAPIKNQIEFQVALKKFDIDSTVMEDKRTYTQPFGSLEFKNTAEKYMFLKFIYNSKIKCLNRKAERAQELIQRIENNSTNRSENTKAVIRYKSVVLKWEELLER